MTPLAPKTIRRRIAALQQVQADAARDAQTICNEAATAIARLQERCVHQWKYIPDAAGGRGEQRCDVCGKYL